MTMNSFHCPILKSQKNQGFGRAYWSSFQNARGQVMIEYLLIVVVSVTLVSALTMALFRPLGAYVEAVNKGYIQCLLETGELPALKGENGILCPSVLPQFGQVDPADGGATGGGGSESTPNSSKADTSGSGSSGSSDTASSGGARPQNRKSSLIRNGMRTNGGGSPEGAGDKTTIIPVDSFEAGNGYMSLSSQAAQARRRSQKTRQIAIASLTEYERKKLEREAQKTSSLPTENESFTQAKKKKIIVKPPPPRAPAEEVNTEMDFGFYFKIFFMIIVIVFLIILLGGQAMQISKNWE